MFIEVRVADGAIGDNAVRDGSDGESVNLNVNNPGEIVDGTRELRLYAVGGRGGYGQNGPNGGFASGHAGNSGNGGDATAQVSGAGMTTGIALVEVYEVP